MRHRLLHILVLAWQALWLLVIVPGHTRGQIVLPGANVPPLRLATDGQGPQLRALIGCCSVAPATTDPNDPEPISQERKRSCAVCFFAARMSVAVAIVFVVPRPVLVEELPVAEPAAVLAEATVRVSGARGPPTWV